MDWSTARPDWEARIVSRQSLIPCPPLFPAEAGAALDAFKDLRVVDVAGSPTFGEIAEPWILDFVAAVFGAYDAKTGKRLIREFFLCVSKKNGKSTLAAGIMLTALIRNWRKSNELLIIAPTIEAAQNSFKPAADMVRANPELDASSGGFLHVQDHLRTITHLKTKASLKVLAADSRTVAGKKAGFVLIDELWEFGKQSNADAMLREATGGLIARPEGFVVSITTQSDEQPVGVFEAKLSYARKVRDGRVIDKKFMPVIYEFPKRMLTASDYLEPVNFYVTNPNLGHSVSQEWLEDEMRKELAGGVGTRNTFLAKFLNVEIGIALASDAWAGAEFWARNGDKRLTLDDVIARSEIVVVGIDGGGLDDLLGLAVLGRDRDTRQWLHWGHCWAHPVVLDRRKSIASELRAFEAAGDLTIIENVGDDVQAVADVVERLEGEGLLPEETAVGVDQAGIDEIVDAITQRGIAKERIVGIPQGWKLNNAILTTERRLAGSTFKHGASAMMAWQVGNAKIEMKGSARTITKQASGTAKIDALLAIYDAVHVMGQHPESALDIAAMVA